MTNFFTIIFDILLRTVSLYAGVFTGYLFIKSPLSRYREQFINIVLYLFTPFLIFASLSELSTNETWIYPVIGAVIITILGIVGPRILSKITAQDPPSPAEICTATFPNALNFPFPIIFAFAPLGLGLASIFLAITIITRNTLGFWISEVKINQSGLKQIVLFPPLWAIPVGLIFAIFPIEGVTSVINHPVTTIIFEIGLFATIMTVGFSLKDLTLKGKWPIFRVSFTRFVIGGIIAVLMVILFDLKRYVGIPLVVQMMAPAAVINGIYAEKFDLDVELTSQIIIATTLIALFILPIELLLVELLFI